MARTITVAALSMAIEERGSDAESRSNNLTYIARTMNQVAKCRPDIVCLPEAFPDLWKVGKGGRAGRELMVKLAVQHRTFMVGSIHEKRGNRMFNTGLVVAPSGEVVGEYDKVHPPPEELKAGLVPGARGQKPFQTYFGKIGVRICFDANWHDGWTNLVRAGAEIIFFPSAFPGGRILQSLALLNNVFVVPAIWTLHSGVIDNTGRWVARTDEDHWWTAATIDLERQVFHTDYQKEKAALIKEDYGDRVRVEMMENEGWFVLEPVDPEVSIPAIMREYGLITFREYIRRETKAQDDAREE